MCAMYLCVCLSVGGFISELREPRYISLDLSPASIHTGVYTDISCSQLTIMRKAIYHVLPNSILRCTKENCMLIILDLFFEHQWLWKVFTIRHALSLSTDKGFEAHMNYVLNQVNWISRWTFSTVSADHIIRRYICESVWCTFDVILGKELTYDDGSLMM